MSLTGDLLVNVGARPRLLMSRVALHVFWRTVKLHRSALVADFLEARHFARRSIHALGMLISVPEGATADGQQEGHQRRQVFCSKIIILPIKCHAYPCEQNID